MSKERENIPQADMLMGSMRSMGYTFEAAIADVIDNSISASASSVRVLFPTSALEKIVVGILDDGIGMSKDTLFEAMRYGSSSSESIRKEGDLGRFGLGMKSASLSQCRILTVVSVWNGIFSAYVWDYNFIQKKKKWSLLELTQEEIKMLPYYELLYAQGKGTLVLWKEFDILPKSNDDQVYDALNSLKDVVANHLSLIFHRYMTKSKHQISFYVNNQRLKAFDPFLESHPKTTCLKP